MTFNPQACGAVCTKCPLGGQHNPVPPRLPTTPRPLLAIVGEAPGENEELQKEPFVGESGYLLDRAIFRAQALYRASLDRRNLHITNAVLCRPLRALSNDGWATAIECCRPRLLKELHHSRHVLTCGAVPLRSLTGKKAPIPWAGGPIQTSQGLNRHTVWPTVHPAFTMRSSGWVPVFFWHVARAFGAALGIAAPWKWPPIVMRPGRASLTMLRRLLKSEWTSWDTETIGDGPWTIMALGVGDEHGAVSLPFHSYDTKKYGRVRGLDQYPSHKEHLEILKELWTSTTPKVFQNGQFDLPVLDSVLGECGNFAEDSLMAHAAVAPQLKHDLGLQMAIEFPAERYKTIFGETKDAKGGESFVRRPPPVLRTYNGKDVLSVPLLLKRYRGHFETVPKSKETYELFMDLTRRAAIPMKKRGVLINLNTREELRTTLKSSVAGALEGVRSLTAQVGMPEINPRSPLQLQELFFRRLGLQVTRRSEETGAPSLDEDALHDIIAGDGQGKEIARGILKFRQYDKLLSTYIEGLPFRQENGVASVHPTWNVQGARTGRWASQEPNCQNIPPGMRKMFVARPGQWMIEADFSQLELRVLAQLANVKTLKEWYQRGFDVHTLNAKALFGEGAGKKERKLAKSFVYGLGYGGSDQTIWEALVLDFPHIRVEDVTRLRDQYFGTHVEIMPYQEGLFQGAKRDGYVEMPLSGRRLYFYGRVKRTEVCNYPIQGTAADLINGYNGQSPTLKIMDGLRWNTEGALFQVHDALYLEGPDPKRLAELLLQNLSQTTVVNGVSMTFPVDLKVGRNWGPYDEKSNPLGMKECKDLEELSHWVSSSASSAA